MKDPWKYVAFPVASVTAYLISLGVSSQFAAYTGLPSLASELAVIAISGLVAGFFVDEVIPAYVEKVRQRRGRGGGADLGGDLDDMDFE